MLGRLQNPDEVPVYSADVPDIGELETNVEKCSSSAV